MEIEPDELPWWNYGNYTGDACPNCKRVRIMSCEDNHGRERIICEKCEWEPRFSTYRSCVTEDMLAGGTDAAD